MVSLNPHSPSMPSKLVQYLAPVEIAHITNFGRRTVLEWLRTGQLEGTKVSGQWRVHPDTLKAFIENGFKKKETS